MLSLGVAGREFREEALLLSAIILNGDDGESFIERLGNGRASMVVPGVLHAGGRDVGFPVVEGMGDGLGERGVGFGQYRAVSCRWQHVE